MVAAHHNIAMYARFLSLGADASVMDAWGVSPSDLHSCGPRKPKIPGKNRFTAAASTVIAQTQAVKQKDPSKVRLLTLS